MDIANDKRIVMTLDAGGTNLVFSAIRGNQPAAESLTLPSCADNLERCLDNIVAGFEQIKSRLAESPVAISFAFPGPADYPRGIIGDLGNLPGFRGGVALGPMLQESFGIPVYLNNDGDLFAYGEAIAGFLPWVNDLLAKADSPKRYQNLFGVTLGTGLGGGIVSKGQLFGGDNSAAGELWLIRHKLDRGANAEDGASIRAVRRAYAQQLGIPMDQAPEPRVINDIATGAAPGNRAAAVEAFRRLGEVAGDAIGEALTLVDGVAVIGGGLSGAHALFLPSLVQELNSTYTNAAGQTFRRLIPKAFNLEDPAQRDEFVRGDRREIVVPGTTRKLAYDPLQRIGVGISRLGTSEAVSIGAYAFALNELNKAQ